LDRKVLNNGFYVLSEEDHFYSLIYHAVFHKTAFSKDYNNRLTKMGKELKVNMGLCEREDFIMLLESYMKKHKYQYVYPSDKFVPFKTKHIIDKELLVFNFSYFCKHFFYDTKVALMKG